MKKTLIMLPLVGLCAPAFAANAEKMLVCHVNNVDGSIDLISVPEGANHLENESHTFDGLSDYEPADAGATGIGKNDENGDGVADGCEPEEAACPCWSEFDLVALEALGGVNCSLNGIYGTSTVNPISYPGALLSFDKSSNKWSCEYDNSAGKTVTALGLDKPTAEGCKQIMVDYCEVE